MRNQILSRLDAIARYGDDSHQERDAVMQAVDSLVAWRPAVVRICRHGYVAYYGAKVGRDLPCELGCGAPPERP